MYINEYVYIYIYNKLDIKERRNATMKLSLIISWPQICISKKISTTPTHHCTNYESYGNQCRIQE